MKQSQFNGDDDNNDDVVVDGQPFYIFSINVFTNNIYRASGEYYDGSLNF